MKMPTAKCYQLPWSESDNPNGWIEPTTFCNLTCPGCYRGADKSSHKPYHLPLQEVKDQIDWFIQHRNIHTLSVSGGEPLLYPDLLELIAYAVAKNLRVMLYTNGVNLTKSLLVKLRDAGVTQFLIHVDRYQIRPDMPAHTSVADLQTRFCELFREVGGVSAGFIQPLADEYVTDIATISATAQRNIDVVSLIVFTLYRDVCWEPKTQQSISSRLLMPETIEAFKKIDGFVPAACLVSEADQSDLTWVFASRVGTNDRKFGYLSPAFYKFIHQRYRNAKGKYLFVSRMNRIKMIGLIQFLNYKCILNICRKYITSFFDHGFKSAGEVYFQTILLLRGPMKISGKWNLCKSCPDRMFYNGKLVPSCILEDLKKVLYSD